MTTDHRPLLECAHDGIDRQLHSLTAIDIALTAAARELGAGRSPAELAAILSSVQAEVAETRRVATMLERRLRVSVRG